MSKFKQELEFLLDTFTDYELARLSSGLNRTVKGKKTRESLLRTLLTIPGKNSSNNPYITDLFRHMNRIFKQELSAVSPETITGFSVEQVRAEDLRFGRMLMCHQDTIIQGKGKQIYKKALELCFLERSKDGMPEGNEVTKKKNGAEVPESRDTDGEVPGKEAESQVRKGEAEAAVSSQSETAAPVSHPDEITVSEEDLDKILEGRLNELEKRLAEQTRRFVTYKEELKQKERSLSELEAELRRQKNKFQKEVDQKNKYKREAEEAKEKLSQKVSEAQKDREEVRYWRHRAEGFEEKLTEQEKQIRKLREELSAEKEKRLNPIQDAGLAGKIAQALEKARAEAAANEKQAAASKREPDAERSGAAGGSGGPQELYFGEDRGSTVLVFAERSEDLEAELKRREMKILWADRMDYKRPRQRLAQVQMVIYDEAHPQVSAEVIRQAAEGQNKRCYDLKSYLA